MTISISYKGSLKGQLFFLVFLPYNGVTEKESRKRLVIGMSLFFLAFSPYTAKTGNMSIINNTKFYLKPYFDSG